MAYLEWTNDLDTGIAVIDGQHRRIVEYINRLQDAIESLDREAVGDLLEELVDYTITHFSFEESLQEKADYEFRSAHQKVHKMFIRKVEEYKTQFEAGDQDVAEKLNKTLRTWLVSHIKNDDADYVPAVKQVIGQEEKSGWISRSVKRLFGKRA